MDDLIKRVNKKFDKVSLALMKDESKEYCHATFSAANMQFMKVKGRTFCIAFTNEFNSLINQAEYFQSAINFPQCFGTLDAKDVLKALSKSNSNLNHISFDRYIDYLQTEHFAYIIEITDNIVGTKTLRLDLFRKIKQRKNDDTKV